MRAEAIPKVKSSSTIHAAMRAGRATLDSSDTPDLDSQVLLAHFLDVDRAFLFAHPEQTLSELECAAFRGAVHRRATGEPIAYITGVQGFYDIDVQVTPFVLIPRPETELLLEKALRFSEDSPDLIVADIGTGSGALAVTYARHRPDATVYATEVSRDALAVARGNAERNGVKPTFLKGDLAEPLIKRVIKVDLLMANLPYIASDELATLEVSRFEPRLALDGGIDGLALIRQLLTQIPFVCRKGALVLLEIGADQGEYVARDMMMDKMDKMDKMDDGMMKMEYMPPDDTCKELPADVMVTSEEDGVQCQIVTGGGIGVMPLEKYTGVDVWGVEMVNAEVCFAGSGSLAFLDATYTPRKQMDLEYSMKNGMTCANIMHRGTVVMIPGMMMDDMDSMGKMDDMMMMDDMDSMDKMDDMMMDDMDSMDKMDDMKMDYAMLKDTMSSMIPLEDCEVITQFNLLVRDGPAGETIGLIPYNTTVPGVARTPNWIKIQYEDGEGWITGHYTDVRGHCY